LINTLIFKPAFFYLIFLNIIGVSSLFKISGYGYFNTFNFFEIIFVIYTFFLIILTKNKDGFKIGLLFLIYCLLNFFIASINEKITIGFVKDFIALNKFYLIGIFLPFYLRNKNEYSLKEIIKLKHLINLLILIFIIKYLISKFLADGTIFSQRPGVFGENNFELFLICVLSLFFFI